MLWQKWTTESLGMLFRAWQPTIVLWVVQCDNAQQLWLQWALYPVLIQCFHMNEAPTSAIGPNFQSVLASSPRPNFFAYETDERKRKREKRAWYLLQGWPLTIPQNLGNPFTLEYLFVILARIITWKWRSKRPTVCVVTCRSGSSARVRSEVLSVFVRGPYCV